MKTFAIIGSFLSLFLLSDVRADLIPVGGNAPCVGLDHIEKDGSRTNHCIRDRDPGTKFTMIEFFSTTCTDCQQNLPTVLKLARESASTTTTRFVALDRSEAAVVKYINDHRPGLAYSVALDLDRDAREAYGVVSTPTLYILNSKNQVVYHHQGILNAAESEKIRGLLK